MGNLGERYIGNLHTSFAIALHLKLFKIKNYFENFCVIILPFESLISFLYNNKFGGVIVGMKSDIRLFSLNKPYF